MARQDLKGRLTDFGVDVALFARQLPDDVIGYHVKRQRVRSATSVGANYREACSARTKIEFASKVQIALQESDESEHWLELVCRTLPAFAEAGRKHLKEAKEISAILGASAKTAKSSPRRR